MLLPCRNRHVEITKSSYTIAALTMFSIYILFPSRYESRVEHYRVKQSQQSFLTIDEELFFDSMAKLVEVIKCSLLNMF